MKRPEPACEVFDGLGTAGTVGSRSVAIDAGATDGARDAPNWHLGRGLLRIRMPNFGWRRRAIVRHDLHHVLTGYPHTPVGEMQMAAWEFAAGRFPHAGATAFCLPLVAMGAIVAPRRTFAAFVRGRRSMTLYALPLADDMLASRIADLRQRCAPDALPPTTTRDGLAFLALAGLSVAWMLTPLLLLAFAVVAITR